jgi:hypothetical protein
MKDAEGSVIGFGLLYHPAEAGSGVGVKTVVRTGS